MTRVGLVHLTPEQLELLSALADRPDFEVVGAVHPDSESTPFKIAQVLAIPTVTDLEGLRDFAPELVVVPDDESDLRRRIAELGLSLEVTTTRELASRYGIPVELCSPDSSTLGPSVPRPPAAPPASGPDRSAVSPMADEEPAARAGSGPSSFVHSHPEDGAPGVAGIPNLEVMLRDGIDELFTGNDDLVPRLERLTTSWAELLGADACALLIEDAEKIGPVGWVVGGPKADCAPAPDPLTRSVLDGVPHVYVRHDSAPTDGKVPESHPRQAIAAFPLEVVRGALWFLNLRLPVQEVDERLMVLRRSARRLGRVLALSGRVARLARDRAEAIRVADLVAGMADASGRREVEVQLRRAIASELRPELAVLRLPGSQEPEIADNLPPDLRGQVDLLLAAEQDLSSSARAALATRREPAIRVGEATVAGLAVPIRRGNEVLGSITVFRAADPQESGSTREWSESERRLLERLVLHAAGALALAHVGDETPPTTGGEILDRRGLLAILRTEVKRAERYSVPFLLTVFELDPMPSAPIPEEELLQAFARRLKPRLRDLDAVARVGHRRFAVLNPHTDRSGGRVVLRARETLVEITNEYPDARGLDVRGNQVVFPGDVATLDELVARLGP